jgi:hypothetical protein
MKELFPDCYYPTEEEFNLGWEKAIFILDTSVLLDLYRYPDTAREELIKIFEKISDKIWIPYQVALEFQRNRLKTISSQKETFDEVKKIVQETIKEIQKTETDLERKLDNFQLEKRHSSISVESFKKELTAHIQLIDTLSKQFLRELDIKKNKQLSITDIDPIRQRIDEILKDKIGNPPPNQEYMDEIYKECQFRVDKSIPPGLIDYNDKQNLPDEAFFYQGIQYHRKYADIVIWLEIIEQAKKHDSIIFVTSEKKDDWWWSFKVKSEAAKTMGVKQELLQEINIKASGNFFWAYQTHKFIEYAKQYFNLNINNDSINQIRDISNVGISVFFDHKPRILYTEFLKQNGCKDKEYAYWTNYIYLNLFGMDASAIKKAWIPRDDNKSVARDYIKSEYLDAVIYCEGMVVKLFRGDLQEAHDDAIALTKKHFSHL